MTKTIVVPLDGSHFSELAVPLACRVAHDLDATLRLIHVHVPIIASDIDRLRLGHVPVVDIAGDDVRRGQEQAYLTALRDRIGSRYGVAATVELRDGPVIDALIDAVATDAAELIVMSTHGRGPIARFWLGSTADALVRESPVPLMLVHPHDDTADEQMPPRFRHILLPLDTSLNAESVVEMALRLAHAGETHVTLLHVFDPLVLLGGGPTIYATVPDPVVERRLVEAAEAYLDQVAERLRAQNLDVDTQMTVGQVPAMAILELSRLQNVDLIALTTHGRSGLRRTMLGSVADKVIRGVEVPVLVSRPQPFTREDVQRDSELVDATS